VSLFSKQGLEIETVAVGDSIGRRLGWLWAPTAAVLGKDRTITFSIRTPRQASEDINNSLKTILPNDAAFLTVSLTGTNPDEIATVLNGILDQFVKVAADLKQSKLNTMNRDLESQLHTADSMARNLETSLENYRIQTITEPREEQQFPLPSGLAQTQTPVMTNYYTKKLNLSALQKDRKAIEDVLRRGKEQGVVVVDAFHTINAVKQAPDLVNALTEVSKTEAELRVARQRYTDEHKVVQDLKTTLSELQNKTVPVYATRLVDQLKLQEADLQKEIELETGELRKIPVRTLTEDKLRRESNAAVSLSQNLQDRLQQNKFEIMASTPDLTILDRAVAPTEPYSSTAPRIILMGVAGSIGFALLLAILLDRIDRRFRYPEQASDELGLTILGAVPVIRKGRGVVRSPAETAQIVEAFRSIRLNLVHSFSADAAISVAVTSPSPGDGKSLVAANLAMSFAEAGYHTVLVDGDTRRGELYRMFHVDRQPGLLDYLDGQAGPDEIVRPTGHDRLSLLPAGSRLTRGPELLGSARMVELMKRLTAQFQVVIVDTPPLGAGVDPFVLGTMTGNVVVVLRAGETDRQLAGTKIQLLDRLPTRVVGAVLNHINLEDGAYKYYAYEYPYRAEVSTEQIAPPAEEPSEVSR
jgi:capsular exopolysaccharide synthesis family protein